jgi:hypothetical protein
MKLIALLTGASGLLAFVISVIIRIADLGSLLRASSSGWWRAAVALIALGSFFALLEIINSLQRKQVST